ncbi:patatin-like phospholipase family protein [Wenzhouxiangella sp. AB-CW3]|uniref:patatin-like phospholipase family protein n=1 Tax=Wenzhouxiangella sp. AB-CW3 TaxID=2771012 RepID=UPI00168B53DE|nr:patatin-like phospholipase family protein [Wenzhouxiangella sp. AB-CW3]QOC24110.1 patatin-like phospholipase family protein [Wenzhouxiangella sp. AB-CW3]
MRSLLTGLLALWLAGTIATPAMAGDEESSKTIGLALGSGGAAGLAHIRMIEVFEELEVRPAAIAGTSIGAIIGALYAAGMDAEGMRELFKEFGGSALDPFSNDDGLDIGLTDLLEIDFDDGSLLDPDEFFELVAERIDAREFDDLDIPLKVVVTNYWDGETVVLEEGDLFEALKASMAVPGLFAPVKRDDKLLIDGGTSNPLPWDQVADHDIVVAIDVTGSRNPEQDESPDLADLLFKTFEIMQQSLIAQARRADPPDIYIKPELSGIRLLYFDRVDDILDKAESGADELRQKLSEALEQ